MALTITSLDKAEYPGDGGAKVELRGTFPIGVDLSVVIVVSANDVFCFSGIPGKPERCVSKDGTTLTAYLPVVAPGSYLFGVTDGVEVAATGIYIKKANYQSGVFGLRAVFNSIWRVGPRNLEEVP